MIRLRVVFVSGMDPVVISTNLDLKHPPRFGEYGRGGGVIKKKGETGQRELLVVVLIRILEIIVLPRSRVLRNVDTSFFRAGHGRFSACNQPVRSRIIFFPPPASPANWRLTEMEPDHPKRPHHDSKKDLCIMFSICGILQYVGEREREYT